MRNFGYLALLAVGLTGGAHAEEGCPPGKFPINATAPMGSAESLASCVPFPDASAASAAWANRWGAVADDGAGGFGASADAASKKKAEWLAIAECKKNGGAKCSVYMTYTNQCIAHATSEVFSNTARAPDEDSARKDSLAGCAKGSGGHACQIHYSACSLPVRMR